MPKLSIIIPTHRRADILQTCLRHLERQTVAPDIEAIVVSDGPDEKTAALFAKNDWQIPVTFLEIPKSQQSVARNEGVKRAQGTFVLFIGDDIFLEPDACEWHLQNLTTGRGVAFPEYRDSHLRDRLSVDGNIAVLGFTTWDPAVGITPVMRWLETSGWQFGYPAIARYAHTVIPSDLQHRFTYTSHISLPREIAVKHPFRTDVHLYGWEDIEWGMRLRDAGVRLYYEPHAKALHHHRITMEDSLRRIETLGRSAVEIAAKVPEFDRVPKGWKILCYRILGLLSTMSGLHRRAFLRGITSAQRSISL